MRLLRHILQGLHEAYVADMGASQLTGRLDVPLPGLFVLGCWGPRILLLSLALQYKVWNKKESLVLGSQFAQTCTIHGAFTFLEVLVPTTAGFEFGAEASGFLVWDGR